MVNVHTVDRFISSVHNVKEDYVFENIKINKINNDIFNFKYKEIDINIPISKFNKIIKNKNGSITIDKDIFKIEKQNHFDDYGVLILNNEKIDFPLVPYFNKFIEHLKNEDESCLIQYNSNKNIVSLFLGTNNDIINCNIHNIFNYTTNLEDLDTFKELIKYYQHNSKDNLLVYDIDNLSKILEIDSNYIDVKDSFKIINKSRNDMENLVEVCKRYLEDRNLNHLNDLDF